MARPKILLTLVALWIIFLFILNGRSDDDDVTADVSLLMSEYEGYLDWRGVDNLCGSNVSLAMENIMQPRK